METDILPRPRKVVDGFTFYNELGMLKYRLEVLYPYVDSFIICESTLTHSGKPKELYYQNNKHHYEKYADKIVHIVVNDTPESTVSWPYLTPSWLLENHQRRCISRGFKDMSDSDIIVISDVDEIPNPLVLEAARKNGLDRVYCLNQSLYYYNIETFVSKWILPKILPYYFFKNECKSDLQLCRQTVYNHQFNFGGWHLSYFGDEKFISNKLKNFAHQEYNSDKYTNEKTITECLKNGVNLLGKRKFQHIPIAENPHLPPNHEFLIKCIAEKY